MSTPSLLTSKINKNAFKTTHTSHDAIDRGFCFSCSNAYAQKVMHEPYTKQILQIGFQKHSL